MASVEKLQILLYHHLTPKGRRLINEAIKLLEAEDPGSSAKLAEIDEWWKLTFADATSFANLQTNMFMIQNFLLKVLLEDYLDVAYKPTQFVDDISRVVADEQKTGPKPLGNLTVRMPVEQLDVNLSHITRRLLRIREGHTAENRMAYLRASNDPHDKETLVELLSGDLEVLDRLHEQHVTTENAFQDLKKAMERVKNGDGDQREESWHSWIQTRGQRLFSGASKDHGEAPRHTPGHFDGKSR